jgi:hypothetical protein
MGGLSGIFPDNLQVNTMRRVAFLHSSLGHTAKVYHDSDWQEYRVKFYDTDGTHITAADYHTDSMDDASSTARYILNSFKALKD